LFFIEKGCQLIEGTPSYKAWRHPPVPLHISFYVFNITNANALNESATPIVEQIGPFVYEEIRNKTDIEEYENGTISYHELRNYTFIPSLSVADDKTTLITTMNIVYMAAVNFLQMEDVNDLVRKIVFGYLANFEKPIMQRTVHELLWGYNDTLLAFLKKNIPDLVSTTEVSVYYASVEGAGLNTFLINSGVDVHKDDVDRLKQVGNIEGMNGQSTVSYWSNDYANMINGTDSTIWHPDTHTDDEVYIFSSDLCRSFRLEFSEKRKNTFGIENYRFILPGNVYSNSGDHRDFCLNITRNRTHQVECLSDGLMSMRTCIKLSGSSVSIPLPIYSSFPHFLDAAPSVQNGIQGLSPNELKHRSFMDVEPITGTVMNGSRRMQVNLNVLNDSSINLISKYKSFVFPLIWLEEHAEIDSKSASEFNKDVATPITILDAMKYLSVSLGGIFLVIAIFLIIRNYDQMRRTGTPFAPPPDETSSLCP
jgi:lysosome membrane protein 2